MFRLALLAFVTALAWLVFAWSDGNQLFTTSFLIISNNSAINLDMRTMWLCMLEPTVLSEHHSSVKRPSR